MATPAPEVGEFNLIITAHDPAQLAVAAKEFAAVFNLDEDQLTDTELRVTLAPLSSRHRSRAVSALCEDLNRRPVRFPGTRLTMRFAVATEPPNRTNT